VLGEFLTNLLDMFRSAPKKPPSVLRKKRYSAPRVRKLSEEQGRLILVPLAYDGDRGAWELLSLAVGSPYDGRARTG